MFLNMTMQRNASLIETAFQLHRTGAIEPNTYVLDIDTIQKNVAALRGEADKYNMTLLAMTKQIGRNPVLGKFIADAGISQFVAVDPWECEILARAGLSIGNVGHIVQIPVSMMGKILGYNPKYITVYSFDNAQIVSEQAILQHKVQDVLLKVDDMHHTSYPGQEGGMEVDHIVAEAKKIAALKGVRIAGLTSFPCVLYNEQTKCFQLTEKAHALKEAESQLKKEGFALDVLNIPSANAVASLPLIHDIGGNLLEPGHAITGTTPLHAADPDQKEVPAIVYVTEVSHQDAAYAYVYGGGNYARGHVQNALVGRHIDQCATLDFSFPPAEAIDYYGKVKKDGHTICTGDTVIGAFRTQIFVTRAKVCLVSGIATQKTTIVGIYDSQGALLT